MISTEPSAWRRPTITAILVVPMSSPAAIVLLLFAISFLSSYFFLQIT